MLNFAENKLSKQMSEKVAKPFLKWAGGKTQLISEIERLMPLEIKNNKFTYIEPFVGSGAVMFWIINNFPKLERVIINDINIDLMNVYNIIASKPNQLIIILENLEEEYHLLENQEEKKKEYLDKDIDKLYLLFVLKP